VRATLEWSGAAGERVDVYRNDERVATVANNGSYTDVIPPERVAPPVRYHVCEAGSTRCSAKWIRRR
jgi:hypothetical protein